MANQSAPSVKTNMGTIPSNLSDFNAADQVDWLVGVSSKAKGEIKCGYGSKRILSSQGGPYGNGSAKSTLFSTATGWSCILTNGSSHYQNFEVSFKDKIDGALPQYLTVLAVNLNSIMIKHIQCISQIWLLFLWANTITLGYTPLMVS